ncbi:NAD-dependent epimerase/dehydratase family protein [Mucilaginibacter sp. X5P1]|uniref:NAD-dependent epimerase/dehydratase family protein n=1 Tax=Mucilaginibacter sp. X5P1 TaxID=2723088 RepID=UPI0016203754|nr:NAD-dependent epimerase/dehydratase family protein [Mucilaginibacter sp. X5P1]
MTTDSNKIKVLVTGGTGFVASHCILQLLEQGYHVAQQVKNRCNQNAYCCNTFTYSMLSFH